MTEEDGEYLCTLCKTTYEEYVRATWGKWFEENTRTELYRGIKDDEFSAIYLAGTRIGAISLLKHDTHYQIEHLYINPNYQSRGIGTKVVNYVISMAQSENLPVRLIVLLPNPAKALYERLGFVVTETSTVKHFMEYNTLR